MPLLDAAFASLRDDRTIVCVLGAHATPCSPDVVHSVVFFFFSSRRRHTRSDRDWSSDVCSSDLGCPGPTRAITRAIRGPSLTGSTVGVTTEGSSHGLMMIQTKSSKTMRRGSSEDRKSVV